MNKHLCGGNKRKSLPSAAASYSTDAHPSLYLRFISYSGPSKTRLKSAWAFKFHTPSLLLCKSRTKSLYVGTWATRNLDTTWKSTWHGIELGKRFFPLVRVSDFFFFKRKVEFQCGRWIKPASVVNHFLKEILIPFSFSFQKAHSCMILAWFDIFFLWIQCFSVRSWTSTNQNSQLLASSNLDVILNS